MGKVPLKTVLRDFLEHYNNLERSSREKAIAIKEFKHSGRETPPPLSLYDQEYIKLKELTESLKSDLTEPMNEGQSDVNRKKNRYKDILPYDKSRVILSEYPGVPGSDYINANYVRGSSGNQRAYIASQGPLHNTLVDFWRMIWETEVIVIVMACNEREAGKWKCEPYWPKESDGKQQYGNITVEHVTWRQVCPDFLLRTFRVCANSEERTICQFHYTTWPDHGVPVSVHPILELVRLMRDVHPSETSPILVHCSAGCGRTGTICSIDYVWALLRTGKLKPDFSLFEIICDMRRQRTSMVQTVEQYILCYKAVSTLFEQHLKLIDTHTYENIDGDGEPLGIKDSNRDDAGDDSSLSLSEQSLSSDPVNFPKITPAWQDKQQQSNQPGDFIPCATPPHVAPLGELLPRSSHSQNTRTNAVEASMTCPQVDKPIPIGESDFPSNVILQRPHSLLADSAEDLRQHEKIVGKATVIRRPSIAKLRAIFDNPSSSNHFEASQSTEPSTNRTRLQRSQSIKDNIRNLNFNIQLEINQNLKPQNRKSKSYTLSAAKLSIYKKHYSIGNLVFPDDQPASENGNSPDLPDERTESSDSNGTASFNKGETSCRVMSSMKHQQAKLSCLENEPSCRSNGPKRPSRSESQVNTSTSNPSAGQSALPDPNGQSVYATTQQRLQHSVGAPPRPPLLERRSNPNAPPKPPRTYQHILDDSCIMRTSEGRLIVTVAKPRQGIPESNFIPINMNGTQPYGYPGNNSIYESLSARKFHLSSPNLNMVLPEQVNYMPSSDGSAHMKSQQTMKGQFNETTNGTSIYGNALSSKSYPRSMVSMGSTGNSQTPMSDNFPFLNGTSQYPVDVFGNQHFQYHQAKPIILQQNFFEPIYGTSARQPFLPPHTSNMMSTQGPGNFVPPLRPRSISQGTFKSAAPNYESIYSNREMCFSMTNNSKQFDGITANSKPGNNFAPIRIQPKENVYAEIKTLKQSNATNDAARTVHLEQTGKVSTSKGNSSENTSKSSSFSKIINAFKVFRIRSSPNLKSSSSISTANAKVDETHGNFNTSNSATLPNGSAINPLNGQPLSRPPHSHRFQAPTQWTQV